MVCTQTSQSSSLQEITMSNGKFVLKKTTKISEIAPDTVLPESDLCIQDNGNIHQFAFKSDNKSKRFKATPGYYIFAEVERGITLKKTELRQRDLLTSVVNTQSIFKEANTFFSKLHVYEMLGEPKARKILIYSQPGMGKSSSITQYCQIAVKEDPGTIIIVWPTGQIEADWVLNFLENTVEYTKKCTRVILIMEDIGGGERENQGESRGVDSSLLDLLDGLRNVFKLPTFMIATTNYPQNLLSALADRPGRFDMLLELSSPAYEEKLQLMEFMIKRALTDEEKEALNNPKVADFSIAHIKEVVVRSLIHDKTIATVIQELIDHKERFHSSFEKKKKKSVGFGSLL